MKTIFVVDDSTTVHRQIIYYAKQSFPVLKVVTAISGEEAIELIDEIKNDLLIGIFDYNMAGMTGIELAEALKDKIDLTKIVVSTANIQSAIQDASSELKLRFEQKPLTGAKFKALIEEYLEKL